MAEEPQIEKKRLNPDQMLERRMRVSERYTHGDTLAQIAADEHVSVVQIHKDMKWCREQWRTRAVGAIEQQKTRELARIDQVEVEAWRAWERSIGYYTTVTTKTTSVKMADREGELVELPGVEETRKREKLAGDPRFLERIGDCIRKRADILGLDAPRQISGVAGGPLFVQFAGIPAPPWAQPQNAAG
jgi:hypothetical protein